MPKFQIVYNEYIPAEQKLREALCTLGNGYFATRGAAEESQDDEINYPGTYLAGGFNRAKTEVAGRIIENEDLVNFPNWLPLSFRTEDSDWLNFHSYRLINYKQNLNMWEGILEREFRVEDNKGRRTFIHSRRFVSMHSMHTAGLQWKFKAENWSGKFEIRSALDGNVINNGVARYRQLESRHLKPLSSKIIDDTAMFLLVQTVQSRLIMAQTASTSIYESDHLLNTDIENTAGEGFAEQVFRFNIEEGKEYTLDKIVFIYTSRDKAISEPSLEACQAVKETENFDSLLLKHKRVYERLWHRFDININNGAEIQQLLRLHIFHLMQTVSFHSINMDVGVPSRGLHGEAYRGHIFWDELYILPFLNFRFPEITRSLLMYRYNRLPEARRAAVKEGYKGAMFPWQSGSSGKEESQVLHLNPESGRWLPDNTYIQRHISSAIAYNIWNYYLTSDDRQFISFYGAEMFLSIACFWGSRAVYNPERKKYEIHNVVGPDEYHTSYPGSEEKGLNNNAYTNVMAAWTLQKALEIFNIIEKSRREELLLELEITDEELHKWKEISENMFIPFVDDDVIAQFEGYEALLEFPWEDYRKKYGNIQRLDRILESEGDNPDRYKVSKQADVLMLFYLFSEEELSDIFNRLGYKFNKELIRKNIEYYRERTSHGSTLSRFVSSWIYAKYDKIKSWENFETLLISDFKDIQGGTTPEGIHMGAMAGSLDLVQRCYSGIEVIEEALWIRPDLPDQIKCIKFRINYRRHWVSITIEQNKLKIIFEEGWSNKVKIGVVDQLHDFDKGQIREFSLPDGQSL